MERKINCSILTPERSVYEGDVDFVVVQAHDGELGFLFNHAPLIAELGVGEIRLRQKSDVEYLFVEGGLVELRDNKLIVLAENALKRSEIDSKEIESRMKEIEAVDLEQFSEERFEMQAELKNLKARLKVASH